MWRGVACHPIPSHPIPQVLRDFPSRLGGSFLAWVIDRVVFSGGAVLVCYNHPRTFLLFRAGGDSLWDTCVWLEHHMSLIL